MKQHTKEQFFFPTFADMNPPKVEESQQVVIVVQNKAEASRVILKEMFAMNPVPQRKEMINRLISEAKCTKQGAATYLQNFKSKNGLTVPRVKA